MIYISQRLKLYIWFLFQLFYLVIMWCHFLFDCLLAVVYIFQLIYLIKYLKACDLFFTFCCFFLPSSLGDAIRIDCTSFKFRKPYCYLLLRINSAAKAYNPKDSLYSYFLNGDFYFFLLFFCLCVLGGDYYLFLFPPDEKGSFRIGVWCSSLWSSFCFFDLLFKGSFWLCLFAWNLRYQLVNA